MIDMTPLEEIEKKYGHIRTFEQAEEEEARFLGRLKKAKYDKIVASLLEPNRESKKRVTDFYNFSARNGLGEMQRPRSAELTRWITPEVLAAISGKKNVLDVGCSEGMQTTIYALNMPDCSFVGLDMATENLNSAKRYAARFGAKNIDFVHGDVEESLDMYLDKKFDAVIATNMLHETYRLVVSSQYGCEYGSDMMLERKLSNIGKVLHTGSRLVLSFQPYDIDDFRYYAEGCLEGAGFQKVGEKTFHYNCLEDPTNCLLIVADRKL